MLADIQQALTHLVYEYGSIRAEEVDTRFDLPTKKWIERPAVSECALPSAQVRACRSVRHRTLGHRRRTGKL